MTVSGVLYTFAAVVWLAVGGLGAGEVRTGRVLWKPVAGQVTNPRAHGWMLLSFVAMSASQSAVMALDGPMWLVVLVLVLGIAAITVTSIASTRRVPTTAPPARLSSPPDPVTVEELFRRHHDDRDP